MSIAIDSTCTLGSLRDCTLSDCCLNACVPIWSLFWSINISLKELLFHLSFYIQATLVCVLPPTSSKNCQKKRKFPSGLHDPSLPFLAVWLLLLFSRSMYLYRIYEAEQAQRSAYSDQFC